MPFCESLNNLTEPSDFDAAAAVIRQRRYGVIEAVDGRLSAVHFRGWPKWVSLPEALFFGNWYHDRRRADRCRLYFNQPRRFSNFLAVPYLLCGRGTQLATVHAALAALDEIARIKRSDALLADVLNFRVSPRLLARYGWVPHKPSRWHRHYIKRFYGEYPVEDHRTRETASELQYQTA
jgi:hypothetical protein